MSDLAVLRNELYRILESKDLSPHFQPIIDLKTGRLIAHEALIRGPNDSPLRMPNELFQTALSNNLSEELELLCRRLSIEAFSKKNIPGKLFLNVSASLLNSENHSQGFTVKLLNEYGISVDDIVIEISEQHPFDNFGVTEGVVNHYRDMGFKIAIDDLGAGYSGLKLWADLKPDYVKIDKHFIQGIDTDAVKREFVKAIFNIGQTVNCEILAEGIETKNELAVIQNIGINLGQGFFLGRPAAEPKSDYQLDAIISHSSMQSWPLEEKQETAATIITKTPTVDINDPVSTVDNLFKQSASLSAVPVLNAGKPTGIVLRHELMELYSTQYGRALYEKKPILRIMNPNVMIVEASTSLDEVSRLITDEESQLTQEIIIVENGVFSGIGHVRDLLKRITDLKVINARHSNPLTLLPGNVPINKKIDELIKHRHDFHVAWFDLNHFKPFNDYYGYAKGDQVIRQLGDMLIRHAGGSVNFVGHIGGDDFVVILRDNNWEQQCISIIEEFDTAVKQHYKEHEVNEGGVWSIDRNGKSMFFNLLSLAIGVVHPDPLHCPSHNEVGELAAMAKKEAKKADGSKLFISRRRKIHSVHNLVSPSH